MYDIRSAMGAAVLHSVETGLHKTQTNSETYHATTVQ